MIFDLVKFPTKGFETMSTINRKYIKEVLKYNSITLKAQSERIYDKLTFQKCLWIYGVEEYTIGFGSSQPMTFYQ